MKILYAVQGTGNGHIARAFDVIAHLKRYGKVDILVSGIQSDIKLPWKVKYRFYGLSFIFGKNGGVDFKETLMRWRPYELLKEVMALPVRQYDLVISDFEPVTAWACKLRRVNCVGLSHQSAVLHPLAPKPYQRNVLGELILKYYAPVSSFKGFHFQAFGNDITTPVIRDDIRLADKGNKGHYTVYLPAYSDAKIIKILSQFPNIEWHVFSKHTQQVYRAENIKIRPVNKEKFTSSMLNAEGVFCNAGFETPAEALFLGKKLCVIPMKGQYEQLCNAEFLKSMGVSCLQSLSNDVDLLKKWTQSNERVHVYYPNNLEETIEALVQQHYPQMSDFGVLAIS
ncbi:glycosyltransferase family protein [Carboxylicivirga sp. M1479]|uniref:glycosyltransferase family protein n=1 Tax=Carboxylicivirga sp. M1479 TaxID=2594476 RepID=UPI0011788976|nr:glycosyltransferase family protein [Carboxylicivirga sp. M1479]TRX72219.1 glycosyl transferase [Carboxylicivirga sp. M1479]